MFLLLLLLFRGYFVFCVCVLKPFVDEVILRKYFVESHF